MISYNYLSRITTYLSVIAVVFFSYIPFLYVINFAEIEKVIFFLLIISAVLIFSLFSYIEKMFRGKIQFYKRHVMALSLYMLFALYALVSFSIMEAKLNDLFTIRTLVLINPVFAIFALLCLQNKKDVIRILYLLSSIYFIFLIVSFAQGNISFGLAGSQNIFIDMDGDFYQTINIYLGLFIICNVGLLSSENKYISIIPKIFIPLSVMGMFLMGGRSSLAALAGILFIYIFKESTLLSFKISRMLRQMIMIVIVTTIATFYFADILKTLEGFATWQRFKGLTEGGDPSLRCFLFSKAIELFFSDIKTIVFGAGINSFPSYIGYNDFGMHPHNIILELLAEYGIVGTMLFITPVIYIISIRKKILGSIYGNSVEEKIIFIIFIYYLFNDFFIGSLSGSWVLIFYIFLLLPCKTCFTEPENRNVSKTSSSTRKLEIKRLS